MMILTPCKFRFDYSPYWEGTKLGMPDWHGYGNVGITPVVRDKVEAWAHGVRLWDAANLLAELRPCANGLIYLRSPAWLVTVFEPEEVDWRPAKEWRT